MQETPPDVSTLGRTITALITAFHTASAAFMGTRIEDRRSCQEQRHRIDLQNHHQGDSRHRSLYRFEQRKITARDLVNASREVINDDYDSGKGSIYIRLHLSNDLVTC
jgi:hypothetical protein